MRGTSRCSFTSLLSTPPYTHQLTRSIEPITDADHYYLGHMAFYDEPSILEELVQHHPLKTIRRPPRVPYRRTTRIRRRKTRRMKYQKPRKDAGLILRIKMPTRSHNYNRNVSLCTNNWPSLVACHAITLQCYDSRCKLH